MTDPERPSQGSEASTSSTSTAYARRKLSTDIVPYANTLEGSLPPIDESSVLSETVSTDLPGLPHDSNLGKNGNITTQQHNEEYGLEGDQSAGVDEGSRKNVIQQVTSNIGREHEANSDELNTLPGIGRNKVVKASRYNKERQPKWPERMIRNAAWTDEEVRLKDPEWWRRVQAQVPPDKDWLRKLTGETSEDDQKDRDAGTVIEKGLTEAGVEQDDGDKV